MVRWGVLAAFLLAGIGCPGVSNDDPPVPCDHDETVVSHDFADLALVEQSLVEWDELRTAEGDTYHYSYCHSTWEGIFTRTTLVVDAGVVVQRSLEQGWANPPDDQGSWEPDAWAESGDSVGSHTEGVQPWRFEEFGEHCLAVVLPLPDADGTHHVGVFDSGLLSKCCYYHDNVADESCHLTVEHLEFGPE